MGELRPTHGAIDTGSGFSGGALQHRYMGTITDTFKKYIQLLQVGVCEE